MEWEAIELTSLYDLQLQFALEDATTGAVRTLNAPPIPSDPAGPLLFTAIQEQLGLKLESARGPVEVLVIDSVSKPSEN